MVYDYDNFILHLGASHGQVRGPSLLSTLRFRALVRICQNFLLLSFREQRHYKGLAVH